MKLLLKSLVVFLGLAAASPALAFSYSCSDWKEPLLKDDFWKEATPATIADCVQDMGFVMGFSVKDRDDFGLTPLHWAALFSRNPEVITALLEAGADINARNDKQGETPLHSAAIGNDNPDVITALLQSGADVNARNASGATPLHWAAFRNSNPDVITALLEGGADGSIEDDNGRTPFDLAKDNEALKNTDAYWALNDARFK